MFVLICFLYGAYRWHAWKFLILTCAIDFTMLIINCQNTIFFPVYHIAFEKIRLFPFSSLQLKNGIAILSVSQVSSPTIIVERAGSYAWTHKSWRVRGEFVRTVAAAVGLFASTELLLQRVLLSPVC